MQNQVKRTVPRAASAGPRGKGQGARTVEKVPQALVPPELQVRDDFMTKEIHPAARRRVPAEITPQKAQWF